jgi:hypothetical protein
VQVSTPTAACDLHASTIEEIEKYTKSHGGMSAGLDPATAQLSFTSLQRTPATAAIMVGCCCCCSAVVISLLLLMRRG